ncbi:MAG: YihA family ribosome biogenesis GTP-binding protein [Flavobacteriales bacterium]|nr:YihA family ribosome biogenesis GTP-binding protein [Flavobacteriales bacterium]|tara:strand:- start:70913 stop:71521 length:609 start_codon:yes stop_codon:yes gene_type:complete
MKIKTAEFVISNTDIEKCPAPDKPEYAFIGRSNVGKSSLINMLCERNKLAKTSATPGKTQLINHFLINDEWYIVDLPGYGYAKVSKKLREKWDGFIKKYLFSRSNLIYTFVLIDSRHKAQKVDLDFMEMLGIKGIPFVIVFTKVDKLSSSALNKNITAYKKELLKNWEELPIMMYTSSTTKAGKDELLNLIEVWNKGFGDLG